MSSPSSDYKFSRAPSSGAMPGVAHLPLHLVLTVVGEIKRNRPMFLCPYAATDPSILERLCQLVYFPIKRVSSGHIASMYGILYLVLKEFILLKNPVCDKFDLTVHVARCEDNYNALIETYDIWAMPSFYNVLALVVGFSKAKDQAKPLLSSTMISTAASHCRILGYGRQSRYKSGNTEDARRLFWTTYAFEKEASLRFGRASSIQENDLDVDNPELSEDPVIRPWDELFIMGIRFAQIQGQIYDRLYSTCALKMSIPERTRKITALVPDMKQWYADLKHIYTSTTCVNHSQIFHLSRDKWDIMYYWTCTTLLLATLASKPEGAEIESRCFKVARLGLRSHLRYFRNYKSTGMFPKSECVDWVLLSSSFSPFIVMFLHAVAATNSEDVALLQDIVISLHSFSHMSHNAQCLYQVCSIFARAARGLVRQQTSCIGTYMEKVDSLRFSNDANLGYLLGPESLQQLLDSGMADHVTYCEAHKMSKILDLWVNGPSSVTELFWGEL